MIYFSIITPTYNRGGTGLLEACIKSVQEQVLGDFDYEHIIVDDGSTDNTPKMIAELIKKDNRLKYYRKDNGGVASAYACGIENAHGLYIIMLDSDDKLSENSLLLRSQYIKKKPNVDLFYGKSVVIDEKGNLYNGVQYQSENVTENQYLRLLVGNYIHQGTPTVKTELLKKIVFPKWLTWSQDYFIWLELLRPENGIKAEFLDQVVYEYRQHSDSYTIRMCNDQELSKKQILLDDKIRDLHNINPDTREVINIARSFEQLYRAGIWDNWVKESQIRGLKIEVEEKSKLIDQILNSKGWKVLEKARRLAKKK